MLTNSPTDYYATHVAFIGGLDWGTSLPVTCELYILGGPRCSTVGPRGPAEPIYEPVHRRGVAQVVGLLSGPDQPLLPEGIGIKIPRSRQIGNLLSLPQYHPVSTPFAMSFILSAEEFR